MLKSIGFIGIGLMGLPMAKNLIKKGYDLKIYNRTELKTEPLKKLGAKVCKTIKDLVLECDVVITMLTDDFAVDEVMKNSDFIENIKNPFICKQKI